jgi:GntR family transcriptional regulator
VTEPVPGLPAAFAPLGPAAAGLRDRLAGEIEAGSPGPGERLGAERELAARLGVSRSTLRAALDALETAGVVHRVRGRSGGIFVSERRVERDLTSLTSLPAYMRRRVLSTATVGADAEAAAALGVPEGALVLEVVRVRLADEQPISLERARFPADRFPGLLDRSLSGSLYELLESGYGLRPSEAEERVEVVGATAAEARVLEVRAGAPLVSIARTAWSEDGRPFERSNDLFRADRVRIVVRVRTRDPHSLGSAVEVVR